MLSDPQMFLKPLPGVQSVAVDLRAKEATVNLADDGILPQVLAGLDDEGYPATVVSK